jgi:hypothetical protein
MACGPLAGMIEQPAHNDAKKAIATRVKLWLAPNNKAPKTIADVADVLFWHSCRLHTRQSCPAFKLNAGLLRGCNTLGTREVAATQ